MTQCAQEVAIPLHSPDRPTPDRTGTWVLDRFQLRKELHVGPGGEVWLGRERDTRRPVAVKLATGEEGAARIRHEAEALARLDHPNVVALLDHGPFDGGWCVVTAHLDASPLSKVLRVSSPAPPRAVGWARQLAQALAHCHDRGVVHRDVKASNVLLARDEAGRDRLVLLDFGIAAIDGRDGEAEPPAAMGSVHTVAPEQVRGAPADPKVDLYAVGVLLYRMLVERYPFHAANAAEVLAAHVANEPPPLGQHRPTLRLPPGLERLVFSCLAKHPDDRPASAAALDALLAPMEFAPQRDWVRVAGFDLTFPPDDPTQVRERPRAPVPAWIWVGAAVLIAMVAGAALWVAQSQ